MIDKSFQKTVHSWASTNKTSFNKILKMCDSLKGAKSGRTLAILAPSYLMHKINYRKLINNKSIETMTVNNGYLMPGTEQCNLYIPLSVLNNTRSINARSDYIAWMNKFKGAVMHGIIHNDGTNSLSPYPLASPNEVKEIICKCPNARSTIWHHSWGNYLKKNGGVLGMLKCPYYDQWTPRKIPWGHCGAISGFAIPLAMSLGYSKIYIVAMGYKYVVNGYHTVPKNGILINQNTASNSWLQFSNKRFTNQVQLAKEKGIELKVGPSSMIEPELKQFFDTFDTLEDIK